MRMYKTVTDCHMELLTQYGMKDFLNFSVRVICS